jgi:membrane-bound lytic murein transglycosylase B
VASTDANQMQTTSQAAGEYGLSPQTLWGVYGIESSFGANPSRSFAGAEGPMQFLPSTWRRYGDGNPNGILRFQPSMFAAANYLQVLGANSDPKSRRTIRALNKYNGNGGGTSVTSYVQSVWNCGAQYDGPVVSTRRWSGAVRHSWRRLVRTVRVNPLHHLGIGVRGRI